MGPPYLPRAPFYFRSPIWQTRHCSFYYGSLLFQASLYWLPFLLPSWGPLLTLFLVISPVAGWVVTPVTSLITASSLLRQARSQQSSRNLSLAWGATPASQDSDSLLCAPATPTGIIGDPPPADLPPSPFPPFTFHGSNFSSTLWRTAWKPTATESFVTPLALSSFLLLFSFFLQVLLDWKCALIQEVADCPVNSLPAATMQSCAHPFTRDLYLIPVPKAEYRKTHNAVILEQIIFSLCGQSIRFHFPIKTALRAMRFCVPPFSKCWCQFSGIKNRFPQASRELHPSGVGAILLANFPWRCVHRDLIPSFFLVFQSS